MFGELTQSTDFDGNVIDYEYNDLGSTYGSRQLEKDGLRLHEPDHTLRDRRRTSTTSKLHADGSYQDIVDDSLSGVTTSTYDVNGNLVELQSPQGTINYTYDPATGEEIGVSTSNTDTQYSYDQAGEMKSVTVTELDGQPLDTPSNPPLVTSYSYDPDGNLSFDPECQRHD